MCLCVCMKQHQFCSIPILHSINTRLQTERMYVHGVSADIRNMYRHYARYSCIPFCNLPMDTYSNTAVVHTRTRLFVFFSSTFIFDVVVFCCCKMKIIISIDHIIFGVSASPFKLLLSIDAVNINFQYTCELLHRKQNENKLLPRG